MNVISRRRHVRSTIRPRLESLETRLTPTAYTVSSLADSGEGSLRAAITSVNADTTPDEIDFTIAGVIKLTSGSLPVITNTVNINGRSAPGFAGAPVVEIDNNGFFGLILQGSESHLAALSIVNTRGPGVTLEGAGNAITVVGNYIGLALDGSVVRNTGAGVFINSSTGDVIGGTAAIDRNVLSGNLTGIQLGAPSQAGLGASILGNFIGTDPTGQAAAPNLYMGITVYSRGDINGPLGSTIGGTDPGAGNTIAFNGQYGVFVDDGLVAIRENSIFRNVVSGIFLANGGNSLESPVLTAVTQSTPTTVDISGTLRGTPNATYIVEIFATPPGTPSGQGQNFIGSVNAVPNADGLATFSASLAVGNGISFTATASLSGRNITSAFSPALPLNTNPNTVFVGNAYALLLNRAPDPSSSFWTDALNNGATPASVVSGIEGSTEYLNEQVVAMYRHYLQRNPDPGGEQAWTSFLVAGGTLEQVAEGMVSSEEYFVLHGGTNQGFITGMYRDILNRAPYSQELANWMTTLNSGVSRETAATTFLSSQEYRLELVSGYYHTYLQREPDYEGWYGFVNALGAGTTDQQVLAAIFGSAEGYQHWS